MQQPPRKRDVAVPGARYLRAPVPLHFPSEEEVPVSKRHLMLRTALFQAVSRDVRGTCAVGSNQFVYWNAGDPGRNLAPDLFVRASTPDCLFDSWKTWERGAPELAVEIASPSDTPPSEWERKLERYQEAGIQEVVRFDPAANPGKRLRVWDRIQGDLVERDVVGDRTPCETLGLHWLVVEDGESGAVVRIARDAAGRDLLLTPDEERARAVKRADEEARLRAEEARLRAEEARLRAEEARLRAQAEQRAAELEARIRELTGSK